jgi:Na+/serine symporter
MGEESDSHRDRDEIWRQITAGSLVVVVVAFVLVSITDGCTTLGRLVIFALVASPPVLIVGLVGLAITTNSEKERNGVGLAAVVLAVFYTVVMFSVIAVTAMSGTSCG